MDGFRMDERDLEPEEPASRERVDELRTRRLELLERGREILGPESDVMHPRPAPREEAPDRCVLAGGAHELEAAVADEHGCRLDALLHEWLAMLDLCAEEALVRRDRLVEVVDGNAEVMDAARPHSRDAIRAGPS
jgi:hypothetical protein